MSHHLALLEEQVSHFNDRIAETLRPFLDQETFDRLDEVPGVNRVTIQNAVAEIGADMNQFPPAQNLASWAGLCPGNEESAGKRKRRRTTKGNVWLRRALSEAAWAAGRSKDTYFTTQYRRLAGRRGIKTSYHGGGPLIARCLLPARWGITLITKLRGKLVCIVWIKLIEQLWTDSRGRLRTYQ